MINKIAHLADIHFQNDLNRLQEQRHVAKLTIESLKKQNPDLIIIAGDLFHNYVKPINEVDVIAGNFLTDCALIAPVVIIDGNHDLMKSNLTRISSIEKLVKILKNDRIYYFNKTGFYEIDNITFAVWYHPDRTNPWINFDEKTRDHKRIYIDLFHDPINNCKLQNGMKYSDAHSVSLNDFKGDFVLAGDIHLQQSFKKNGKEFFAYPSSLYAGNFGEGDENFHGYLLWDLAKGEFEKIQIKSDYKYFNLYVTEDFDFENVSFPEINASKFNFIKIHWINDAANFTFDNRKKIKDYLTSKYEIIKIIFDKTKIINKSLKINKLDENFDITNQSSIDNEITELLKLKGYEQSFINEVIELDKIITSRLMLETKETSINDWKLKKIILDNFKSHGEEFEINLEEMKGIIQIYGENQMGKCVHPDTEITIEFDENEIVEKLGYLPEFLK